METFINLKPKDIKILKEQVQEVLDLDENSNVKEDEVELYMELIEFFEDIADDLKNKIFDITGFKNDEEKEEKTA